MTDSILDRDINYHARTAVQTGALIIGGNFQGLGLLRSLFEKNIPAYLLDNKFCIGRFSKYPRKFFRCPSIRERPLFFEFLKRLAQKENLEGWIIFPEDDETLIFLSRYKSLLERYYRIPVPPWEVTRFAVEKRLTCQLADKFDIATPRTYYPLDIQELRSTEIKFPAVLILSVNRALEMESLQRSILVKDRQGLLRLFRETLEVTPDAKLMVQETIPDGENHRFSVFSLCKTGELLGKVSVRRIRQYPVYSGYAVNCAVLISMPGLEETARRFLRAMGYYGLSEIEFILDARDGKYKLIEMHAHTREWYTLAARAGINLPYLLYCDLLGLKYKSPPEFSGNIRWLYLSTDPYVSPGEIAGSRKKISDYINLLKGLSNGILLFLKDPLPIMARVFLISCLWIKHKF